LRKKRKTDSKRVRRGERERVGREKWDRLHFFKRERVGREKWDRLRKSEKRREEEREETRKMGQT
jgi:hypothetical protein